MEDAEKRSRELMSAMHMLCRGLEPRSVSENIYQSVYMYESRSSCFEISDLPRHGAAIA